MISDDLTDGSDIPDVPEPSRESPERFDPNEDSGKLVHSEHFARYLWAAQTVEGRTILDAGCGTGYGTELLVQAGAREVLAIDASSAAVSETKRRVGDLAEVMQGDIRALPFDDASLDLIVCFEVIEHVEDAEQAVREFARTLRPDGCLLVSSPNPRVYPQGNPHHVHEYVPDELRELLGSYFAHVALGLQHPWLGSLVTDNEELTKLAATPRPVVSRLLNGRAAGHDSTYVVAIAGHAPVAVPPSRLVLGEAFEVKWWMEQVEQAGAVARASAIDAQSEAERAQREAADAHTQVAAAQRDAAEARREAADANQRAEEASRRADEATVAMNEALRDQAVLSKRAVGAEDRLRRVEVKLIELDQELANALDRLSHCEPELERATWRYERAEGVVRDLQDSVSWKITTPIRLTKQLALRVRRARRG